MHTPASYSARAAYQWSVNVSVYVHARARRLEVGHALYDTLLPSYVCRASFGFTVAGTFSQVGYKMGTWHDVGYWQLTIQSSEGSPAPPQPLPALLNDGNLHKELTAGSMKVDRDVEAVVGTIDAENLAQAKREMEQSAFTS